MRNTATKPAVIILVGAMSILVALGCQTTPEPMATAPDVVGMPAPDAEAAIAEAGLTTGQVNHDFSSEWAAGLVMSQNPAAGAELSPGAAVRMTVSQGVRQATVPDIVGMTQAQAEQAIAEAGLTTGHVDGDFSEEAPAGEVLAQNPAAGAELPEGDGVDFVVSEGLRYVTVPDVTGHSESAAESLLVEAGLAKGGLTRRASHDVSAGTVMSQEPEAGAEHPYGDAVDLVLSGGPPQATVPNIVGQREFEAEAAIQDAGLTVGTVTRDASPDVEVGRVIRQDPSAGAQQTRGSQVDFVLSEGALRVTVPDVTGLSRSAAQSALQRAGVSAGAISEVSDANTPSGHVVRQDPPGNMGVEQGTSVQLFIAR